ncbi:MAG: YceI family protein [Steroidobacteraceae bacterium]
MRSTKQLLAAGLLVVSGLLLAAPLAVGPATQSKLTATFKQEGVAVESPFTRFTGQIDYDPVNVAAATASIEVDMTSLDLGDPAYSAELVKKSWFDSAAHPRGVFKSTAIKPLAANRFEATGQLTIKGRVQNITVPVTVAAGAFDGSFTISRKAFGIGDPIWEEALDDKVVVKFHLVTQGARK